MKLVEYNAANAKVSDRFPFTTVRISRRSGVFQFSKRAISDMNLKTGGRLLLFQDQDKSNEWYLLPSDKELSFKVTIKNLGGPYFICTSAASKILGGSKLTINFATYKVEKVEIEGKTYFKIDSRSPINSK